MMKKKIKIGYADVDIQLIDKKLFPKWSTEHLGDYDANNQVIRILSKQRPSEELNTLFHEVIHAAVIIVDTKLVVRAGSCKEPRRTNA
jgi:hypothetical protein